MKSHKSRLRGQINIVNFRDLEKGRLMCIDFIPKTLSRSPVTPRHQCVITHKVGAYNTVTQDQIPHDLAVL